MLTHLHIRDLAILEGVELELNPGLTVLTGETGAGKSIFVEALMLAGGARAATEQIRAGAARAEVSAHFDIRRIGRPLRDLLEEQSIEAGEEELLVRRVINADGRSRAYLNGQSVPLQVLREVVGNLLDVHGQHEFQSLVRPAAQRQMLDAYGRHEPLAGQVEAAHRVWLALMTRQVELETRLRDRESRLELLGHQVAELEALAMREGEFEALSQEALRLGNYSRLLEATQGSLDLLYEGDEGSAHERLSRAQSLLRPLVDIEPTLAAVAPLLEEAAIRVAEAARELGRFAESLDLDESRQAMVEKRLAAMEDLARKHRCTPSQLPARHQQLADELRQLQSADQDIATLQQQSSEALATLQQLAAKLTAARVTAGRALGKDISVRMQGLGMAGGRFQVDVSPHGAAEPQPHGLDRVEFRVTANPGQPLRSVAKVASGGELARLSLAVQVACTAGERRSMVFDEVDSGIGGAVAEIVGRELHALGERGQVLCVTHLPQVAAQAHHHLRIAKHTDGKTTRIELTTLDEEARIAEIARMLGGMQVTAKALEHASEMLAAASRPAADAPRRRPR